MDHNPHWIKALQIKEHGPNAIGQLETLCKKSIAQEYLTVPYGQQQWQCRHMVRLNGIFWQLFCFARWSSRARRLYLCKKLVQCKQRYRSHVGHGYVTNIISDCCLSPALSIVIYVGHPDGRSWGIPCQRRRTRSWGTRPPLPRRPLRPSGPWRWPRHPCWAPGQGDQERKTRHVLHVSHLIYICPLGSSDKSDMMYIFALII